MGKKTHSIVESKSTGDELRLPIEVEVYINSDGSVTFADLASDVIDIASKLNPDQPLACDVLEKYEEPSAQ